MMIMELVWNRNFTLINEDSKQNKKLDSWSQPIGLSLTGCVVVKKGQLDTAILPLACLQYQNIYIYCSEIKML